jgi:streptogramin lyase
VTHVALVFLLVSVLADAAPDSAQAPGRPSPVAAAARDTLALVGRLEPGAVIALAGEGRGQVREPAGVASDAFGRVWVSDGHLHRVQRFDRDGRWLGENGALGSGEGEMRRPGSVAPLGAAHMAVLDRENRRVLAYDLFGRLEGVRLDLASADVESELGRVDPGALASDRGGALYVADPTRERVLVFDGSGGFVRALGGFGTRPGQLRGLQDVAATPRGELVVTERLNARVQRLDAGGRPVQAWSLPADARARGALPVAVDDRGRVAVADEPSGRLWLFDRHGRMLAELSGLGRPRALAFGVEGALLVAEADPPRVRRIVVVTPDGE